MGTAVLDSKVAAHLVAWALDHVWSEMEGGCCPVCCGPCGAVQQLLDTGQLAAILDPYAALLADELWAGDRGGVHPMVFARAWGRRCPECEGGPAPAGAVRIPGQRAAVGETVVPRT